MAKLVDFIQDYLKPKFYKYHKVTLFGIRKYEFSHHPILQFSLTTLFLILFSFLYFVISDLSKDSLRLDEVRIPAPQPMISVGYMEKS
jgi:hypothetical protein